jgi:hypothetical protein
MSDPVCQPTSRPRNNFGVALPESFTLFLYAALAVILFTLGLCMLRRRFTWLFRLYSKRESNDVIYDAEAAMCESEIICDSEICESPVCDSQVQLAIVNIDESSILKLVSTNNLTIDIENAYDFREDKKNNENKEEGTNESSPIGSKDHLSGSVVIATPIDTQQRQSWQMENLQATPIRILEIIPEEIARLGEYLIPISLYNFFFFLSAYLSLSLSMSLSLSLSLSLYLSLSHSLSPSLSLSLSLTLSHSLSLPLSLSLSLSLTLSHSLSPSISLSLSHLQEEVFVFI